jgi:hypothetical protein
MFKIRTSLLTLALALPVCLPAQDQRLTPTPADDIAAQEATSLNIIASRALTDAGRNAREADLIVTDSPIGDDDARESGPTLFPADLSKFVATAQTLETTTLHNIYINQPPSAWGDPVRFLNDLNHSSFIHITDQYVGVDFNDRYPLGTSFLAFVTPAAGFPPAPTTLSPLTRSSACCTRLGRLRELGTTTSITYSSRREPTPASPEIPSASPLTIGAPLLSAPFTAS